MGSAIKLTTLTDVIDTIILKLADCILVCYRSRISSLQHPVSVIASIKYS